MTFIHWPTGITAGGAPSARHLRSNPKTVPSDSHAGRHHGNNDEGNVDDDGDLDRSDGDGDDRHHNCIQFYFLKCPDEICVSF